MDIRPIDANELLSLYENAGTLNIDAYKIPVPVVRQNIMDAPTLDYAPVQQWISVQDRLPETQKPVLVCAKDKTFGYKRVHVGYHECTTEDYEWQDYEGDTECNEEKDVFCIPECWYETNAVEDNGNWMLCDDYVITHWMPLPEPPKEERKAEDCRYYTTKCSSGGGCIGTKEIDPCKGDNCERWKPKEE